MNCAVKGCINSYRKTAKIKDFKGKNYRSKVKGYFLHTRKDTVQHKLITLFLFINE